ncbi:PEP-CTERM sorting domain-containing protein [Chitinimonas arctica]|uniref:PEP-CTERM sorting domain-containing protein n=1 Tax=Chitinimonas arctica TaxID=2594795 RepID=UPI001CC76C79|nr:PEP-CTERM sorting domain-containing protein [Chitinimonas arctica]
MKKTIVLALGLAFASQAAFASNSATVQLGYFEDGNQENAFDTRSNVTASATAHSSLSIAGAGIQRDASASATFDPTTTTFKGSTQATLGNATSDRRFVFASSQAFVNDGLRVNSSAATAQLKFTVKYDSVFNTDALSVNPGLYSSPQRIRENFSSFQIDLTQVHRPSPGGFGPTWTERLGGQRGDSLHFAEFVRPEREGASNIRYTNYEAYEGKGRQEILPDQSNAANWNGMISFTLNVQTNTNLDLAARFGVDSFCAQAYLCNSTVGAHSFQLGLEAIGGELVSSNGYGYTMGASVPEPESYAMLLAGLGLLGFVARRKARNAA